MANICIVGYGAIGPVHAEAVSLIPGTCLYGICDTDKERADRGASQYGCKVFYNIKQCLEDKEVDCIHLCVPHYLHFEMITQCVEAGKQVVVEKPIVMKKEEFELLLSKYAGTSVFPIMQNRTNTCIKKLKEIICTEPQIGKLQAVKGILTWCRDAEYYNSGTWRGTKAYEGGGVLINQAVHTLDLMIYLGGNVEAVHASTSNKSLESVIEVEDTIDARLQFENGAIGIFYATNAYGTNSPVQLELEFEHASFRYAQRKLYRDDRLICQDEGKFLGKDYWGSGHGRQLYDLYVNQKPFTIDDVKNTMQIMFAMYESAETNSVQYIK